MNTKAINAPKVNRIHWMDNLRTLIIFLVILYHVGGVYEATGMWGGFWIVDDPDTLTWVGIMGIIFDVFLMSTLFLVSGYLAVPSLQKKRGWEFLKGKFRRLIVPWFIAVFTLIPLYKVIFLYSRNLPQEQWNSYFHMTNPNSQNWLWFLPVLFLFNIIYLLMTEANIKLPNIPLKWATVGAVLIGFVYSFSIGGLLGFRSWTLTPLLDFENERLLLYFITFLLGVLCYQQGVFADKPQSKTGYVVVNAVGWVPITLHIFARLAPFVYPGAYAQTALYRLAWWLTFYLALPCLVILMIETFRRYFDKNGRVWGILNQNSYGVYIIHVVVLGIIGTLLLETNLTALVKYLTLVVLTYLVSNLLVSFYRLLVQAVKVSRDRSVRQALDVS